MDYAEVCLSGAQTRGCGKKQRLVWTGAGQQQPHAPGVVQHHGADLEEFPQDRANIGAGQFAVGQGNSADRIQQHIGQSGEQHPVLIGPPFVATGTVGEQVQLKQR